jgi:hypothetical protein
MRTILAVLIAIGATVAARDASAEEAIAYGDGGVRIGATVVFAKPVLAAAYDEAQDLVWINTKGTLQVIDLRTTPPKVTLIAKKMPAGGFDVAGLSSATTGNIYASVYPVLTIGKAGKFSSAEGVYGEMDLDPDGEKRDRKVIKKIKIVGKKWLKALRKRKPRTVTAPPLAEGVLGRVDLPADLRRCEDEEECGTRHPFGTTPYDLVTIEHSCGDACYIACVLYDPKTSKFAAPTSLAGGWGNADPAVGECGGYLFAADGVTYLMGQWRCSVGSTGVSCADAGGWYYVGWTP